MRLFTIVCDSGFTLCEDETQISYEEAIESYLILEYEMGCCATLWVTDPTPPALPSPRPATDAPSP